MILNMHPMLAIPESQRAMLRTNEDRPWMPQAQEFLRRLGDPRAIERVVLTTKPIAPLLVPAIEGLRRLPTLVLHGYGVEARVLGELNLDEYRHRVVRPQRAALARGEPSPGFRVLNGRGHALGPVQRAELASALRCERSELYTHDVSVGHVDLARPERGMVERLLALNLPIEEWTNGRIVLIPPGNGIVAAIMATTIYGLAESWPKAVRFRRGEDGEFHITETADLQTMEEWGQGYAAALERDGAPIVVPRLLFDRVLAATADAELRTELQALTRLH